MTRRPWVSAHGAVELTGEAWPTDPCRRLVNGPQNPVRGILRWGVPIDGSVHGASDPRTRVQCAEIVDPGRCAGHSVDRGLSEEGVAT